MTIITHINDVLPSIDGVDGFIHAIKEGYQVIDYVFMDRELFNDPVRLECRGLKFDMHGNLIARPFHKFFNIGEQVQYSDIDWSKPHVVMDKLDGTMIHTCLVNGEVRFMTRMGITDHSLRCEEKHLTDELKSLLEDCLMQDTTPIFEWTSPENQIVIPYKNDTLSLLALRDTTTGEYYSRQGLKVVSETFGVPLVKELPKPRSLDDIYSASGIEGVVIWFTDDDFFVKVKSDEYVQAHRAVSFFEREKHILPMVLDGQTDDILPVLDKDRADKLREYEHEVLYEVSLISQKVRKIVDQNNHLSRKEFALDIVSKTDPRLKGVYFRVLDGNDPLTVVKEYVIRNPELLEVRWNGN